MRTGEVARLVAAVFFTSAASLSGQDAASSPEPEAVAPAVLTIGEAVRRALIWNPDLRNAVDSLRSVEVNEAAVRSTFFPQVTPLFQRARADESGAIAQRYGFTMSEQLPFGPRIEGQALVDRFPDALVGFEYGSNYRLTLTQPLLGGSGSRSHARASPAGHPGNPDPGAHPRGGATSHGASRIPGSTWVSRVSRKSRGCSKSESGARRS